MTQRVAVLLILLASLTLTGCNPNDTGRPAFRHQALYERLQAHAETFSFVDGAWLEDFGDAAFYGPAYYARAGLSEGKPAYLDRAAAAHAHNLEVIRSADLINGDVNEIIMAALGAIETMAATGDRSGLADLNTLLDNLDELVTLFGGYLDANLAPGYAMETYGPTSINGLLGLLFLQHALLLGDENRDRYLDWGAHMADRIHEEAWTGERYAFGSGRDGLYLYPNVTLILLNTRLYQLTGDPADLDRALDAYLAIGALRVETDSGLVGPGRYFSPYSAAYMGAQSSDYTTLSSQNFVIFALSLLYLATSERAFLQEIDPILDFLEERLEGEWCLAHIHKTACDPACTDGAVCMADTCVPDQCHAGILHHWMDGRLAIPNDPEFFCSGCNLQLLYSLWFRQEMI